LQDALVVNQHAFLNEATWQSAGRVLLGLDAPAGLSLRFLTPED
jgi:hypothetical protein